MFLDGYIAMYMQLSYILVRYIVPLFRFPTDLPTVFFHICAYSIKDYLCRGYLIMVFSTTLSERPLECVFLLSAEHVCINNVKYIPVSPDIEGFDLLVGNWNR
jgi:hypothetical protein